MTAWQRQRILLPTPRHCNFQNGQLVVRSLEHNVLLDVYRHVRTHKRELYQNKTVIHRVRVHLTHYWHHCRRSAWWHVVKTLRHTGLLGTFPVSLSRLRTVWSEILCCPGICVAVAVDWHPDQPNLRGGGYSVTTLPRPVIITLNDGVSWF